MAGYVYNGVAIQYCQTLQFSVEEELDPTNTDGLWNVYTIRVRGFVTATADDPPSADAPTGLTLSQIQDKLQAPRRAMSYTIGDTVVVEVTSPPDAKLGPIPTAASVQQVNTGLFLVECGCVVRRAKCDASCEEQPDPTLAVVSLRWGQTETFNEAWFSQLTTTGKLIVRSDVGVTADAFRNLTLPLEGPPPNYRRLSSRYTLSPDGTVLDFEYVDMEQDRMPGFPAVKAQGSFTVTVENNAKRMGTCEVTLDGPRGVARVALMARAVAMCISKFRAETAPEESGWAMPYSWSMREDLIEPQVRVSMTTQLPPMGTPAAMGSFIGAGDVPFRGPDGLPIVRGFPSCGMSPYWEDVKAGNFPPSVLAPPTRKAVRALLVAAMRDPCLCAGLSDGINVSAATPVVSGGRTGLFGLVGGDGPGSIGVGGESDDQADPISVDGGFVPPIATILVAAVSILSAVNLIKDNAPYNEYLIRVKTSFDRGRVQMPGTGVGDDGGVAEVVQAHGGMQDLLVSWVASRRGKPPVLPAFFVGDDNLEEIDGAIVANQAEPSGFGNAITYTVAGYYRYAVLDPSQFSVVCPTAPFADQVTRDDARLGTQYWTEVLQTSGADGTNPFVEGGVTLDQVPTLPGNIPLPTTTTTYTNVAGAPAPPAAGAQLSGNNTSGNMGGVTNGQGGQGGGLLVPVVNP